MQRFITLGVIVAAIIGGIWYLEAGKAASGAGGNTVSAVVDTALTSNEKAEKYELARELVAPAGFINSPNSSDGSAPFTVSEFIGDKVILLDIWTYSCINCQRTLPYITAWDNTYADQGLLIIGVHTPEFEFEKDIANVRKAVEQFGIDYPVVLDNDYGTWRNYNNRYWPRKYLIDIDGYIVYDHIGEGAYEETEKIIQQLLAERAERLGIANNMPQAGAAVTTAERPDQTKPRTPEIYFGAWRNELLGNGTSGKEGAFTGTEPTILLPNFFYLGGAWDITREYAVNTKENATIRLRYSGADVYMVAQAPKGATMRIEIDGELIPASMRGADVATDGTVQVGESRLYHLVHDESGWAEHTIELIIETPGLEAFTFTFG